MVDPMSQWVSGKQLARILLVLLALPAFAEPPVVDTSTGLALDPRVKGATSCVVLPEALYEPESCEGIPRGDPEKLPKDKSLHVLAVMQRGDSTVMLTVSSVNRPGIGQMSGAQIQGFVEATMARLADEFKVQPQLVKSDSRSYTLQRIQDVPVVRWEYTTELEDSDPQANVASGVAFLVPSRDTLDIISFNTNKKDLALARELSEQVMATLKVPVTIDTGSFGGTSWSDPSVIIAAAVLLFLLIVLLGWLWWRRGGKAASTVSSQG
jgi:hypothetical protein